MRNRPYQVLKCSSWRMVRIEIGADCGGVAKKAVNEPERFCAPPGRSSCSVRSSCAGSAARSPCRAARGGERRGRAASLRPGLAPLRAQNGGAERSLRRASATAGAKQRRQPRLAFEAIVAASRRPRAVPRRRVSRRGAASTAGNCLKTRRRPALHRRLHHHHHPHPRHSRRPRRPRHRLPHHRLPSPPGTSCAPGSKS